MASSESKSDDAVWPAEELVAFFHAVRDPSSQTAQNGPSSSLSAVGTPSRAAPQNAQTSNQSINWSAVSAKLSTGRSPERVKALYDDHVNFLNQSDVSPQQFVELVNSPGEEPGKRRKSTRSPASAKRTQPKRQKPNTPAASGTDPATEDISPLNVKKPSKSYASMQPRDQAAAAQLQALTSLADHSLDHTDGATSAAAPPSASRKRQRVGSKTPQATVASTPSSPPLSQSNSSPSRLSVSTPGSRTSAKKRLQISSPTPSTLAKSLALASAVAAGDHPSAFSDGSSASAPTQGTPSSARRKRGLNSAPARGGKVGWAARARRGKAADSTPESTGTDAATSEEPSPSAFGVDLKAVPLPNEYDMTYQSPIDEENSDDLDDDEDEEDEESVGTAAYTTPQRGAKTRGGKSKAAAVASDDELKLSQASSTDAVRSTPVRSGKAEAADPKTPASKRGRRATGSATPKQASASALKTPPQVKPSPSASVTRKRKHAMREDDLNEDEKQVSGSPLDLLSRITYDAPRQTSFINPTNEQVAALMYAVRQECNTSITSLYLEDVSGTNNRFAQIVQPILSHALSSRRYRLFCRYEWFYATIDRLFFQQNEFVDCLSRNGLGTVRLLARSEWSRVRQVFGKPRRFSSSFLKNERSKLEQFRKDVRDIQVGRIINSELVPYPEEVPARLIEGAKVSCLHPETGEIHAGTVVGMPRVAMTDGHEVVNYRIKFDRRELGSCLVPDINIMAHGHPKLVSSQPNFGIEASFGSMSPVVGSRGGLASPISSSLRPSRDPALFATALRLMHRKHLLVEHLRKLNDVAEKFKQAKDEQDLDDLHSHRPSTHPSSSPTPADPAPEAPRTPNRVSFSFSPARTSPNKKDGGAASSSFLSAGPPASSPSAAAASSSSSSSSSFPKATNSANPSAPSLTSASNGTNTQVESLLAPSPHFMYPLAFRQQYAWVVFHLEQTSSNLADILSRLRPLFGKPPGPVPSTPMTPATAAAAGAASNSSSSSAPTPGPVSSSNQTSLSVLYSDATAATASSSSGPFELSDTLARARFCATEMVPRLRERLLEEKGSSLNVSSLNSANGSGITELVTRCMTLFNLLRAASERPGTAMSVDFSVTLQDLQPKSNSPAALSSYQAITQSTRQLRQLLN